MSRSVVVLTVLAAWAACSAAETRFEFTEVHMGVPVRVVLYAPDEPRARRAARAAFARIAELDRKMSDYRADSEVRGLERHAGDWVEVSSELFQVLARAREIAQASGGAFDPTVGPLVALWREARRTGRMPDAGALDAAGRLVGWRNLELDSSRRAVRLAVSGMRLDLGGIAKGYILAAALEALAGHGMERTLVEAGGDVVVGDAPPGAAGWHIAAPLADSAVQARAAALTHAAIATSGPSEQLGHVVNPRTGFAVTTPCTATVIARDAATADALATALTVLGADDGKRLLAGSDHAGASVRCGTVPRGSGPS